MKLFFYFLLLITLVSCQKEDVTNTDPRLRYVGDWNFKSNSYSYSGFYDYNVPPGYSPIWTYTESSSSDYNDSTGIISIGLNPYELIIKYCNTCPSQIFMLNENGVNSWTLTDSTFFNDVVPPPPSYSPSYSTLNIEGWKL
ncbi:MAG: hypothetical protein CL844_00320 [Crocinitomicaceae bacterium]|nr:hypothetical protein [Crocinitomicaceae bacterium]|tara:strand:+ start:1354 stop:1776 length:423 start_codon:yes stop_codon:yes gene_type:complete